MNSVSNALSAQRLLVLGLLAVMSISAYALWELRSSQKSGRAGALPSGVAERADSEEDGEAPPLEAEELSEASDGETPSADEDDSFDPGALSGRTLCGGEPVPGVELRLFLETLHGIEGATPIAEAKSDFQGRYRLVELPPHVRLVLHAQHARYLPGETSLYAGRIQDIELAPSTTLRGTVRDAETGRPIPAVRVSSARLRCDGSGLGMRVSATSDAQGAWQLPWAALDSERLCFVRPACVPEHIELQVARGGDGQHEILLGSEGAPELELYSLETGAALAHTEVLVEGVPARTNERGRLGVPRSLGGTRLALSVALVDGCVTRTEIDLAGQPGVLRIPLARGGRIRGRVLNDQGTGVEGAEVRMTGGGGLPSWIEVPEGFELLPPAPRRRTAPSGRFELVGLPPREGAVVLRTRHPQHAPGRSELFEFSELGATREFELRLEPGGTVEGNLRLDGQPAGLYVHWRAIGLEGWTRANDRGDYRIMGLPAGEVRLRVRPGDEDEATPRQEDRTVALGVGAQVSADFDLVSE